MPGCGQGRPVEDGGEGGAAVRLEAVAGRAGGAGDGGAGEGHDAGVPDLPYQEFGEERVAGRFGVPQSGRGDQERDVLPVGEGQQGVAQQDDLVQPLVVELHRDRSAATSAEQIGCGRGEQVAVAVAADDQRAGGQRYRGGQQPLQRLGRPGGEFLADRLGLRAQFARCRGTVRAEEQREGGLPGAEGERRADLVLQHLDVGAGEGVVVDDALEQRLGGGEELAGGQGGAGRGEGVPAASAESGGRSRDGGRSRGDGRSRDGCAGHGSSGVFGQGAGGAGSPDSVSGRAPAIFWIVCYRFRP
ncbi:hypothetical protein SUDANB9_03349 [Streptomyces sp. enrichment culture]